MVLHDVLWWYYSPPHGTLMFCLTVPVERNFVYVRVAVGKKKNMSFIIKI